MANAPFFRDDSKPFAQRHHGMSLDVVRPHDIPQPKVMYVKDESLSLKNDDIHRSRPHYNHLQFLQKPDLSTGCTDPDHAGGRARSYYPPMDRRPRDLSLTTADIDKAQPKASDWKGNRHVDPVNPQYELPSHVQRAATPPRWNGRHGMDASDIEHTSSRVLHPERNYCRDPNDSRDIEHSSAQDRMHRQTKACPHGDDRALDVQDINGQKKRQARCVNPLEPVYKVSTAKVTSLHTNFSEERLAGVSAQVAELAHHGEVHGSKPRKLQWDNGEPQLSLQREDIHGCAPQRWVGSVAHNIYDSHEVRPMISFHDPGDIPGTQVGSLAKGLVTRRNVNPLNPRYPMLDGDPTPHSMPNMDAQNPHSVHPMQRSQAGASSLPNLRSIDENCLGGGAGTLQTDSSCVQGLQSGRSGRQSAQQYEPSWTPSGGGRTPGGGGRTPLASGRSASSGRLLMQQGPSPTMRLDGLARGSQQQSGELSRRSSASHFSSQRGSCR